MVAVGNWTPDSELDGVIISMKEDIWARLMPSLCETNFFIPTQNEISLYDISHKKRYAEREEKAKAKFTENSRYVELQNTRIRHAQGLELKKAQGGVSFLYDEPPNFEKYHDDRTRRLKEIEGKYRYEWQKNAPRHRFVDESLPTDVAASTDLHNPFGIRVEKIKIPCFRCGETGHVYSDRVCPAFNTAITDEEKRRRGKQIFTIEVEPARLDRLVEDFNKTYEEYHSVSHHGQLGYRSRKIRLKEETVNELRISADIDPSASFKSADEEYIESLDVEQRDILFKVIRRMIRDKKRNQRLKLMEQGKSEEAQNIHISDDSDSDGEFDISEIENEFVDVLDEIVFGKPAVKAAKENQLKSFKIAEDIAKSLLQDEKVSETLPDREAQMRNRLTERYARKKVKLKYLEQERSDPLADALLVYVAEGKSKKEIEENLQKLQKEKRKNIQLRIEKKKKKAEIEIKKLKDKVLRQETPEDPDITPETIALRKLKHKQSLGIQAVEKIKSIKERLIELDQKILNEENERKVAKLEKIEMDAARPEVESQLRQRIQSRKIEHEKQQRRQQREEKRRLRKMNKKLEKLREKEVIEKVGKSSVGEEIQITDLDQIPRLKSTQSKKEIQVYTKQELTHISKRKKDDPTLPNSKTEPEVKTESKTEIEFETVIRGKKQKIDSDFLKKFGIKID